MIRPAYETARLELVRLRLGTARGIDAALASVARVCSRTLDVERVSIWLFEEDFTRLVSQSLYTRSTDTSTGGDVLDARRYPTYCAALRERRAIVADDARTHPSTRELRETYLDPIGITSMLDVPLYRRGEVVGVVCNEQVGPPREWKQAQTDFASSVAEVVSTMYEQRDALELDDELSRRAARQADAERLEAIARVCAAVAHDFNNVLTTVALAAGQLAVNPSQEVVAEMAHALDHSVGIGSRLIGQLRSFVARPAGDARKQSKVADVIDHLRPIIDLLARDIATLTVQLDAPEAQVPMGPGPLEQILLNLCLNARDAIPVHGHIDLIVRILDGHVVIEVRDDGTGIAPEVLPNVFEPYFTTKEHGTGLGLATVRDLVTEHGGSIAVASVLGRGTTFTVTLPRA